jgi:hypothetical protein
MIGVYCAKIAYCNVYQNDVQSWQVIRTSTEKVNNMAGTRKWWSVKKIGGELKTVQAVDIRSAALKSFGLNPARQQYGIWFDSETRIAQVTKHTKQGTVIVGAVAIYNEGV